MDDRLGVRVSLRQSEAVSVEPVSRGQRLVTAARLPRRTPDRPAVEGHGSRRQPLERCRSLSGSALSTGPPNTAPLVSGQGEIPSSGRLITITACDMIETDTEGRVRSYHIYFDQAGFLAQLGLSPSL